MANTTTNAIVPTATTNPPAHLSNMGSLGNENMDSTTLATPRLYLLQQLSPQVTKGKPEYVNGASAGQFINSLTNELSDDVFVANLFMQHGFTAFKRREFGVKDFQGTHPSLDAATSHLRDKGLNPLDYDIDETHTHTLALIDAVNGVIKTPILFGLKRSGLGMSRNWNSQIVTLNASVPRFASIWRLSSTLVNGAKGSYYVPAAAFAGWASEHLAHELHDLFTGLYGKQPLPQDAGV